MSATPQPAPFTRDGSAYWFDWADSYGRDIFTRFKDGMFQGYTCRWKDGTLTDIESDNVEQWLTDHPRPEKVAANAQNT